MSNIKDKAKEYLGAGLSVVFLLESKLPNLSGWKDLQREKLTPTEVDTLFSGGSIRLENEKQGTKKDGSPYTIKGFKFYPEKNPTYLGIIAGKVSGGLEVIDVDCKYDLSGSLWNELKELLEDNLGDTFNTLVIAKTKSGGYHIYYKCSEIEGNLKLANRATIERERDETYQISIKDQGDEAKARKVSENDKIRVLIETRGEGGYVVAPPSKDYLFIQGEPQRIPEITPQERDCILAISRDFNQVEEPSPQVKKASLSPTVSGDGITSLEDYNLRGDAVELLKSHGWSEVGTSGERVNLLRPGETTAKTSGNYHIEKRCFISFSTSTDFNPGKPYSPAQIYNLLKCGGDWSKTAKQLGELGYGNESYRKAPTPELKTERITVKAINKINKETSVISKPGDSLKVESLKNIIGDEIIITSPGSEAQEEVLKAIKLAQITEKRIYIIEGGEEVREYKYQLRALFEKYGSIQEESGQLTDREKYSLLDEVIGISLGLQPIDKDIFKKHFLSLELGISEEALSIALDKLTSTKEKEAQAKEFKKLLSDATQLQDKGETKEALELLDNQLKEVKLKGAESLLPPLTDFNKLLEDIATIPPGYRTGYPSLDKFIDFTPGAISLIGGRPSHGKTTFMFNLLLEMAKLYPEEKLYFFSYEEPVRNISVKLLNRLTGTDLRPYFTNSTLSSPTNYEFIKSYIKSGRTDIAQLEEGKRQLKELIDSQRITIIGENYSVEDLSKLIAYLQKKEKIGAVFIDYIQRMRTERRTQDKRTEIGHISDHTLQIAKETGLPIILGAQLNRATISTNKKPTLENLKEAGNLEEDANLVLSVYNESREKDDTPDGESYKDLREVELEFKALKNREGEVNQTARLTFDKWTGVIKEPKTSYNKRSLF